MFLLLLLGCTTVDPSVAVTAESAPLTLTHSETESSSEQTARGTDSDTEDTEQPTEQDCGDGVDDDGDGLVDCEDADCHNGTACAEGARGSCSNGLDDDDDGLSDCTDDDCWGIDDCRVVRSRVRDGQLTFRDRTRWVQTTSAAETSWHSSVWAQDVVGTAWLYSSSAVHSCGFTVHSAALDRFGTVERLHLTTTGSCALSTSFLPPGVWAQDASPFTLHASPDRSHPWYVPGSLATSVQSSAISQMFPTSYFMRQQTTVVVAQPLLPGRTFTYWQE